MQILHTSINATEKFTKRDMKRITATIQVLKSFPPPTMSMSVYMA